MSDMTQAAIAPKSAYHIERVNWVRHWNDHLFSFAISRPPSFRFRSGEFVMLGLPGETRPILRAYSIASPAYMDELEFLSIKSPDGPLTSRLQKIKTGDEIYLARKATGTLVADALKPGKRLFLLATGTGLAPFLSIIRDADIYDRFAQVVVVHSVRQISDLAYRDELNGLLAGDPLVQDQALVQLSYIPIVTRENFPTRQRITTLLQSCELFRTTAGQKRLNPSSDRVMLCGSMAMIQDCRTILERFGFIEGSNAQPGDYVIEKAFVG
ncbi:ferredoxin--NADP reductase [Rhizorhapis suberifaciens]|uniref:ferredoxin--NADP(+) reductase n=1 Tax=Rhizorhapis suberifaciens TaxID=13656 RepID=A0A840HRF4_9SPHN|nr:ferredoxin--NADP reductase [Rhizorhapis suberifaciens]MBB4640505.1 ferredoxin--NADP+ reductase [Rhizorhapis suberifaciens]